MFYDLWQGKREDASNEKVLDFNIHRVIEDGKKPVVQIWRGKSKKPTYHYAFSNVEKMENWIQEKIKERRERLEQEAADKEIGKKLISEYKLNIKVGDIFYTSWGYGQTNIDFYKVLEVRGRAITFVQIGYDRRDAIENCFEQYKVTPDPNNEIGKPFKKIVQVTYSRYSKTVGHHITLTSYANMYEWGGEALHMTNYY